MHDAADYLESLASGSTAKDELAPLAECWGCIHDAGLSKFSHHCRMPGVVVVVELMRWLLIPNNLLLPLIVLFGPRLGVNVSGFSLYMVLQLDMDSATWE